MAEKDSRAEDTSELPVRILDSSTKKWQDGSQPFELPEEVKKIRLEFVCFVGDNSESLDVDISAFLFAAKGTYFEAVGYGCPVSTDGSIAHKHDSVQPEAGKIVEDIEFNLPLVHKRVYAICMVATTTGSNTFANLKKIQLRIMTNPLAEDPREIEVLRIVFTREGCLGRKDAVRPHPPDPNVLVLGDIRRLLSRTTSIDEAGDARGGRKGGVWNVRAPKVVSGVIKTPQQAIPLIQRYLRAWIPSIEVLGQELIVRRVYDIVSLLPLGGLDELRRNWAGTGASGATKENFLENMLRVLLRAHAHLRDERQRVELTSLLSDLFDQISGTKSGGDGGSDFGSGKDTLAWEQFTTFWVEAATINTHSEAVRCWADETLRWELDSSIELAIRKPAKLISLPLMHLIVGVEERSSFVSLLNGATGHHSVTLCPSALQTIATGGLNPHESFLTVLDVECIDSKGLIVISSTDYAISVWHYNQGSGQALWRFSFHNRSAQILVSWVAHETGFLISAGVDHVLTTWCVDKQLRLAVIQGHRARVTGVTYLVQHGQFATSSFDKTVRLWDADRFKPIAEVKGHSPVKFIGSHADLVLCITLEVEAHVLSVTTRGPWCRLVGHRRQIIGASIVHFTDARQGRQTRAITGDTSGEFFIWDIGKGQAKDGCAEVMQTFSIYTWFPNLGEVAGFERFHRHQWSVHDGDMPISGENGSRRPGRRDHSMCHVWPDIVVRGVGGTAVVRTRQLVKDARPVYALAYNDKSMDLIASTGQHLRFWDVQTSDPLREIASPCPLGITCMTTDKPDLRRLYLGTSDGTIAVMHIVTGQLLFEAKDAHNSAVMVLVVCPDTREVISIGADRRIAVHREKAVGIGLVVAGGIDEAHSKAISACAVSPDAQLIASASGGEIRLWNQKDFSFEGGICGLEADVLGLVFLPGTSCFLTSDSGGDIVLWVAEFGVGATALGGAATEGGAAGTGEKVGARKEGGQGTRQGSDITQQGSGPVREPTSTALGDGKGEDDARGDSGGGQGGSGGGCANAHGRHSRSNGREKDEDVDKAMVGLTSVAVGEPINLQLVESATPAEPPAIPPKTKKEDQSSFAVTREALAYTLRPGVLLSSRQLRQQHQQHPSPIYEIHLHSIFKDGAPIVPQNRSPVSGSGTRDSVGSEKAGAPGQTVDQQGISPSKSTGDDCVGVEERKKSLVVIGGCAGGWVSVWQADGLVAAAGVDEEAMVARLARRHQQDDNRGKIRLSRNRRSGLMCCPPSAAYIPAGGSISASVKGMLEALPPTPPYLRWEAHCGSPVSTLCALDATTLVATASTDSTLRLFTLADVQVGAQLFVAAETLGEIDMRDTESLRIDRAEMWSCPSLTAADVKPAADIEAYRVFSGNVRAEVEETAPVCSPIRTEPMLGLGSERTQGFGEIKQSDSEGIPQTIDQSRRTSDKKTGKQRPLIESNDQRQTSSLSTFLTALQKSERVSNETASDRKRQTQVLPESSRYPATSTPQGFASGAENVLNGSVSLENEGKPANTFKSNQEGHKGTHTRSASGGDKGDGFNSSACKMRRSHEIDIIVAEATGASISGDKGTEDDCRGFEHKGGRRRPPVKYFDKLRATLTSAGVAKNHFGKVLYGNMYSEIKSGSACNSLVVGYSARRNPRGDIELNTKISPFLRDKLPSLAKRKRRKTNFSISTKPVVSVASASISEVDTFSPRDTFTNATDGIVQNLVRDTKTIPARISSFDNSSSDLNEKTDEHIDNSGSVSRSESSRNIWEGQRPHKKMVGSPATNSAKNDHCLGKERNSHEKFAVASRRQHRSHREGRIPNVDGPSAGGRNCPPKSRRVIGGESAKVGLMRERQLVDGGATTSASPMTTIAAAGVGPRRVMTSASLTTLSLQEADQTKRFGKNGLYDELDRALYVEVDQRNRLRAEERVLTKSESLSPEVFKEQWRQMQERFDSALLATSNDEFEAGSWRKLKSKTKSTVRAYIRTKPGPRSGSLMPPLQEGEETDEALLGTANFGAYLRSEVEALGSVFLLFARDGLRFTYDQWRKALLSNKGVHILRGLQFGILDEDNDGEVSLGDITRVVFRMAPDRDLARIRKFLELWLTKERRKYRASQVRKVITKNRETSAVAPAPVSTGVGVTPHVVANLGQEGAEDLPQQQLSVVDEGT